MIVAAHQPNFIPWLGYFDKMNKADLFITVDHVQMERQSFQNRARIKTGEGERCITVPVIQESRGERIMDKRIDNSRDGRFRWSRKMFLTLKYAYQSAPYYRAYEPVLREIFEAHWERLGDLNGHLIELCRGLLDIRTPMRASSSMKIKGAKTEMILNMCREAGADTYLSGRGASMGYMDLAAFERAGIRVLWQDFSHPRYKQYPACGSFIPNLAALDLIFNCGPRSPEIFRGAPAPRAALAGAAL